MENIKNIIFDYGNVIFMLDFKRLKEAWSSIAIHSADQFYSNGEQDPIFNTFETGETTAADFRNFVRARAGNQHLKDEEIDRAWNSLLRSVTEGTHEALAELKKRYRTFLLSNINPIHYDFIMDHLKNEFGFDGNAHLFEKTYYSHLIGLRKPDMAIFEKVLIENGLNAAETLFIDDMPANLVPAKALGIQTFLITAPDTLQDFIKRENLL